MDEERIETVEYGKGEENGYPDPLEEVNGDGDSSSAESGID